VGKIFVKASGKDRLLVGTSGYSYSHWGKGVFYPKGLKSTDWLSFYAGQFNTVELNVSFYRRPTLANLQRWAGVTPEKFVFAAKFNRMLTHYQKLRSCEKTLVLEKVLADGLGKKLGVVLAQLPPSFPADLSVLKDFLDLVKSGPGRWVPRLAFEFRHSSWFCDPVYHLLNDYQAALCLADWDGCPTVGFTDIDFLYIRRHSGRNGGDYARDQIEGDAGFIKNQLDQGKTVYVYYNNDFNAYAIKNARELLASVRS
jgi:uncharacterized protein YecE (DUF72 family)